MKTFSHTVKKILFQVLENWVEYLDVSDRKCEEKKCQNNNN
jgi:hypothetical protein